MTRMIPELAPRSPSFSTTPTRGQLDPTNLTCTRPSYTAVFRWCRVSHLEPSGPYVETLLPGHRGLAGKYTGDCASGIYKKKNIFFFQLQEMSS
ncbi:hypothetical protein AVEN_112908-1 [Araneus ventricosus]|uniref:Uncharacterized protein n=1 Tax=Araneus ventricosus TaxID=182803 RepID=A0A4Y2LUV1_ARAVE|nr:hypothetical protein AVEN_112908-1 [Araneus ventricosus]